jgi:hypothetical protein
MAIGYSLTVIIKMVATPRFISRSSTYQARITVQMDSREGDHNQEMKKRIARKMMTSRTGLIR